MGKTATPVHVAKLAKQYEPDVIVLAESRYGAISIAEALNENSRFLYQAPFSIESRLQFFTRAPPSYVTPIFDGNYLAIRNVRPVLGKSLLIIAAHLPSKLRLGSDEQTALCARWSQDIAKAETKVGHHRTVVIGDLNMNPFEPGMVGSEGFHAVSCRSVVARGTRTVLSEERLFFYNPMWSLLGDGSGVPGTFYYSSGKPMSYFWNMFDQVLIRPELARNFNPGDVEIATTAGDEPLLTSKGFPNKNISDHLPIVATLRLEDEVYGN